jgi:hypothetical protein
MVLGCTSNGGFEVNGIPLDQVAKNWHCLEAEKACRRARAMARDLDARSDKGSDDYFELRQACEAQQMACEEAYDRCQPDLF